MQTNNDFILRAKKNGIFLFNAILSTIINRINFSFPLSEKLKWNTGIHSEMRHWEKWIQTKGLASPDDFNHRLDPDSLLQPEFASLLPEQAEIHILDVGAGPLTLIGKKGANKSVKITAIDILADEYNELLEKYHICPLVKTQKLDVENLTEKVPENTYDLVVALNSIDHTSNPEKAIIEMLRVVKVGSYIFLRHTLNEAENQKYSGLHQWNLLLSSNGDFLIKSQSNSVNVSEKYSNICEIRSEIAYYGEKLKIINRIRKK